MSFLEKARAVKEQIRLKLSKLDLAPRSQAATPFHNPIAHAVAEKKNFLSQQSRDFAGSLEQSAKLITTAENYAILQNYFENRKKMEDKLGKLYLTMCFEDFLLRLLKKRYKEVYLDGRAVVPREDGHFPAIHDGSGLKGRRFLAVVGTEQDKSGLYQEYLTLEEMVLSPLLLPQVTSLVIGTGNRSTEPKWNVKKEFESSIDLATFSYPAAAEFRDGRTAHYDLLFLVKPKTKDKEYKAKIAALKSNVVLMAAAHEIYGPELAFEAQDDAGFVQVNDQYFLHRASYLRRTKNTLKLVLLSADKEMAEKELGRTFQLKGLGLGAFSFSGADKVLEELYMEALRQVLKEIELIHINCVNLINLPTTLKIPAEHPKVEATINKVQVLRTHFMDPTSHQEAKKIGDIGGTVFCGDSGSGVGNEGNIGLGRSSSDDPATQYSMLDPLILDPQKNATLNAEKCLFVCDGDKNKLLPLKQAVKPAVTSLLVPRSKDFEQFCKMYDNHYRSSFFKNPFSQMRSLLLDNEVSTMSEVRKYAAKYPDSRTATVLKVFDALQKLNVSDLKPFEQKYQEDYNSTYFHNPWSKMRTMLFFEKKDKMTIDDVIEHTVNNPLSRSARVVCKMKK